ncbi:hypothetical protein WG906_12810 [Pedobacter sp. P351]|uniref:hypothetical protein n=1 Tax=Pedobacter superstes TaxID=3133441 RepID=UPI0030A026A0
MENLSPQEAPESIRFDSICIHHLRSTRRWTKFLSLLGFCFISLVIIVMGLASIQFFKMVSILAMLPLAVIGLIYFFPIYYLWQFSKYSKLAIEANDTAYLGTAIKFLNRHYAFMGILVILMIVFYVISGISMFTQGRINPF